MNHTALWVGFFAILLPLLALDLGLLHRKAHTVTLREALFWSVVWVGLALAFAGGVFYFRGARSGMEFLTGYFIEEALSVDNVFLFAVIFESLKIPEIYRHRVLLWGVLSAIVLRGLMIAAGAALLARFHGLFTLFGILLILTGVKMFAQRHHRADLQSNRLFAWLQKRIPLTEEYHGQQFFATSRGRRVATPLFLALLLIEATDLMFAMDSIPAIFAVSRDPFIVFTSNVFAIMGLRSLYFVLSGIMEKFRYLKVGLAAILVFVGFKMLGVVAIPIGISLLAVVTILALTILFSVWRSARTPGESRVIESPRA